VVATKEIGLEVNANKTKHMDMSRDQNAGWSHSMKIINPLPPNVIYTVNSRFFVFEGNGENERNMCENEKS
jgi:hypothetical protein